MSAAASIPFIVEESLFDQDIVFPAGCERSIDGLLHLIIFSEPHDFPNVGGNEGGWGPFITSG